MPNDTLGDEAAEALKGASDYIRSDRADESRRKYNQLNLEGIESRLVADIDDRSTGYKQELHAKESAEINDKWEELGANTRYVRINAEQKARQKTFEDLRRVNEGVFPKNISPVLYVVPLILVGMAEWYVNYSTFAAKFIPAFAIAGTLIVAFIFATASHIHGSHIKQLSEILHPSVVYRNELGRKVAFWISTLLLIVAFVVVIWLRYQVIAEQLGINDTTSSGTFGASNSALVWSNLGPTIALNFLIWGLGTLYAWAVSEKVPKLRDQYRGLLRSNKKLEAARRPFVQEQKRIKAHYDRERDKNEISIKEYRTALDDVRGMLKRLNS